MCSSTGFTGARLTRRLHAAPDAFQGSLWRREAGAPRRTRRARASRSRVRVGRLVPDRRRLRHRRSHRRRRQLSGRPGAAAELGDVPRLAPTRSGALVADAEPDAALDRRVAVSTAATSRSPATTPTTNTIDAAPEDQLDEPPAKEIVTHEYGHHIANHQNDAPWSAEDYGTKRWSSYEHICARDRRRRRHHPGDEGAAYSREPGRGVRRVLSRAGADDAGPGAERLGHRQPELLPRRDGPAAAARRTSPRRGPDRRVRHVHGSFGYGTTRTIGGADDARRELRRPAARAGEGSVQAGALQRLDA